MFCNQCGANNPDGSAFCSFCGAKIITMEDNVQIPIQTKNKAFTTQSQEYDSPQEVTPLQTQEVIQQPALAAESFIPPMPEEFSSEETASEPAGKKSRVKTIVLCAVIGVVIAALAFIGFKIVSNFLNRDKIDLTKHPVFYVKDDTVYLRHPKNNKRVELGNFGVAVELSEDGKHLFYSLDNGDFYYRNTTEIVPKGDDADEYGVKIASDITNFLMIPDGKRAIYEKNDKIYVYDLKDSYFIEKEIDEFYGFSEDYERIMYERDNNIYIRGLGENDKPEKIISSDYSKERLIYKGEEDLYRERFIYFDNIYYIDSDDDLYLKEPGKDEVKVLSDAVSGIRIGDTYFAMTKQTVKKEFSDFFNDDCEESDKSIVSPNYDDYLVPNGDGAMLIDHDAYDAAKTEYKEKCARDSVRETYKDKQIEQTTYTLYKIDGSQAIEIDSGLSQDSGYQIYSKVVFDKFDKIDLSTVKSSQTTINELDEYLEGKVTETYYLFENGEKVPFLDYNDSMRSFVVSGDKKYLYLIDNGNLIKYEINNNTLVEKEILSDEVRNIALAETGSNMLIVEGRSFYGVVENANFKKLTDEGRSGAYIDEVISYIDDAVYFIDDGDLIRYQKGEEKKIDTDVYVFEPRGKDFCYYIKDYDIENREGDLYLYKNGKSEYIDKNVSCLYMIKNMMIRR